jgi:hypothetical protein
VTHIWASGIVFGYLGYYQYEVAIDCKGVPYNDLSLKDPSDFPRVRENDRIVLTGKFLGVSTEGWIILCPEKVINEGY